MSAIEIIREYCGSKGIRPIRLAYQAGLSPSTMHRILRGQYLPSRETAIAIERATGGEIRAAALLGVERGESADQIQSPPADKPVEPVSEVAP